MVGIGDANERVFFFEAARMSPRSLTRRWAEKSLWWRKMTGEVLLSFRILEYQLYWNAFLSAKTRGNFFPGISLGGRTEIA